MAKIVGIDLGTTKSAIAVWQNKEPRIIPDSTGENIVPSVVALDPDSGQWVVGRRAKELATASPLTAIYSAKRFMGRRFSDQAVQTALSKTHVLYEVEESRQKHDVIEVVVGDKHLLPQQVSAKLLEYLKANAEASLGEEVTEAVITVPAYFHDSQRQATRDAGGLAGLKVKRVLNEPTAACLAFGYQRLAEERKLVAVYDLGGGTFDISILEVGRGPFRVRTTNGDTYLGGDDIDWLMVDWAINKIGGPQQARLKEDIHALARLRAAVEQAKKELSSADKAHVQVAGLLSQDSGITDLSLELTRAELDRMTEPFIQKTLIPCGQALHDAGLKPADVQEVLLVGGQTRMPSIRQAVRDYFGREPNTTVKPEEVVALGAAVQAAILAGEATGLILADVVPLSLGVSTRDKIDTIIKRNTPVPVTITKLYSTATDNQESVEIKIYQGEKETAAENNKLGEFILKGILPARAEEPEIEVTFHVDQDGILHVTGRDLGTGNQHELTITDSMKLSEEQIRALTADEAPADENPSDTNSDT